MAIVFLHTVSLILIVLYESVATKPDETEPNIFDENLCFETIFKFMSDQNKCDFSQKYALRLLKNNSITCQIKCSVRIQNIYWNKNWLEVVDITFGGTVYEAYPCPWPIDEDNNSKSIQASINCTSWNKGNLTLNQTCSFSEQCAGSPYASCLGGKCSCIEGYTLGNATSCVQTKAPVGGYCKNDEQCQGSEHSGVCKHDRCVCKTGHVLTNLECHEGNLALNQSCSFSEQCAGLPYASCLGGNCSCVDGYTAENATSCVQSQKSILPKFQHQEDANIGTSLGALFGGLVLGVILTTATVMIMYRRSKKHVNKREEFKVTFADNETYSSAKVVDPNAIQTKNEKREVSTYPDSEETSVYNNVYGKQKNGQTQDDVYNHLHEQGKQDNVDYYDHACAASANIGDIGDYSHLRHTTS